MTTETGYDLAYCTPPLSRQGVRRNVTVFLHMHKCAGTFFSRLASLADPPLRFPAERKGGNALLFCPPPANRSGPVRAACRAGGSREENPDALVPFWIWCALLFDPCVYLQFCFAGLLSSACYDSSLMRLRFKDAHCPTQTFPPTGRRRRRTGSFRASNSPSSPPSAVSARPSSHLKARPAAAFGPICPCHPSPNFSSAIL